MATTSSKGGGARKGLISRTMERCKSGLMSRIGAATGRQAAPVAGCFPVHVGPERARFVVRAELASHPLFRRLLDDAEREHGHAARGPLALPSCDVDAFLDVLWQMEHGDDDDDGEATPRGAASSPICGLRSCGSKGRGAAGYRMMNNPRSSSPVVASRWAGGERKASRHARTRSYS
jgi:SAUR family protein